MSSAQLYKKVMNVIASLEKMADFMEPETFLGEMWVGENTNGDYFMYPADSFGKDEILSQEGKDSEIELQKGWWGRMSAPGYLDATDWMGPYESEEALLTELQDMYGYDEYA